MQDATRRTLAAPHSRAVRDDDRMDPFTPLTPEAFRALALRAARSALGAALSDHELDELAQEVVISTARRTGTFTPTPDDIGRFPVTILARRAVSHWRDSGKRLSDATGASLDALTGTDGEDGDDAPTSFLLAALAPEDRPRADVGWREVADALALTGWEAEVVRVALGEQGASLLSAAAQGVSAGRARNALTDARKRLLTAFPTRDHLRTALADAEALDGPLLSATVLADGREIPTPGAAGEPARVGEQGTLTVQPNGTPVHPDPRPALPALARAAEAACNALAWRVPERKPGHVRMLDTWGERTPDPAPVTIRQIGG
jgi:DNA-directed RNA polymerase specialized sigma24 family protein